MGGWQAKTVAKLLSWLLSCQNEAQGIENAAKFQT
jgi:hypothetical protein